MHLCLIYVIGMFPCMVVYKTDNIIFVMFNPFRAYSVVTGSCSISYWSNVKLVAR